MTVLFLFSFLKFLLIKLQIISLPLMSSTAYIREDVSLNFFIKNAFFAQLCAETFENITFYFEIRK